MSDDDKSMDVQVICNQRLVTYNKLQGVNLMGISAPWEDYPHITSLDDLLVARNKRCEV